MRILIASTPTYEDAAAVGPVIDELVQNAGGELITLVLAHEGGACAIAERIVEESVDSGLEVEHREPPVQSFDGTVLIWEPVDPYGIDRAYIWFDDADGTDGMYRLSADLAVEGIPVTEYHNSLSRDRVRANALVLGGDDK